MEKITHSVIKKLCSYHKKDMNDAFNLIYDKYRYLVYYVAFNILKNEDVAKEIVNDAFIKLYEKRSITMTENKIKYFLLVTAKNLSINKLNQAKDHLPYSDDTIGKEDDKSVSLYLEKFKDLLDEEEYQYLVLHLLYEFTFKEIARANHLTVSQVSSKYQRGLKKLRDYYGGDDNGQD